jgi:hypothetical protein
MGVLSGDATSAAAGGEFMIGKASLSKHLQLLIQRRRGFLGDDELDDFFGCSAVIERYRDKVMALWQVRVRLFFPP